MRSFILPITAAALLAGASPAAIAQDSAGTVTLQEAIDTAMRYNPEILQAQFNKEAIEFERKQAEGLNGPRVDIEASASSRTGPGALSALPMTNSIRWRWESPANTR